MTVYGSWPRTDRSPERHNETTSAFLRRVAGEYWDAVRDLIDQWFSHLPLPAQQDVGARLTKGDNEHFAGAFLELYLHETLVRSGYTVECHPEVPGTTRQPDFLARRDDETFYLEARALGRAGTKAGKRVRDVYEALDRVESPDFFLWIDVRTTGAEPLPTRQLRASLERWLRSLNADSWLQPPTLDALPRFRWTDRDWELAFRAIPKSPGLRGQPGVRPLGIFGGLEAEWIDEAAPVRAALREKGRAYGQPDHGLVIALGTTFFTRDDFGITNALFGTEQYVIATAEDGTDDVQPRRAPDGYFYAGGSGWARRHVSGVLVVNNLHPAWVDEQVDTFWAHPDPLHPVHGPDGWTRREVVDGQLEHRDPRVHPRDLFGLPATWPPGEPFPDD